MGGPKPRALPRAGVGLHLWCSGRSCDRLRDTGPNAAKNPSPEAANNPSAHTTNDRSPNGAPDCSYGWSHGPAVTEPVDGKELSPVRPEGSEACRWAARFNRTSAARRTRSDGRDSARATRGWPPPKEPRAWHGETARTRSNHAPTRNAPDMGRNGWAQHSILAPALPHAAAYGKTRATTPRHPGR